MSNPTSSFGWIMPTSTDLVTDLPADFEVFGQAVDSDLADLLGGTTGQVLSKTSGTDLAFTWIDSDDTNAIQNAIVDAKGDLIGATAADTPSRLAVGTDGQLLTADSTEATGLKWSTVSSESITLLQTISLAGVETVTSASIASTYTNLLFVVRNVSSPGANYDLGLRFNGDTGNNYTQRGFFQQAGSASGDESTDVAQIQICTAATPTGNKAGTALVNVYRYTDTSGVVANVQSYGNLGATTFRANNKLCYYNGASAISTVTFFYIQTGANWSTGTIYIYGVK
jgi:hypothetical protein